MKEQNVYDFQPTLRNVPGVMFRSWNLMGTQTSHSLYIRARGSSHLSHHFNLRPLRISDSEVFLAVNNLFDKEYEYNKGYPMPGFTIFGGVNIKFL